MNRSKTLIVVAPVEPVVVVVAVFDRSFFFLRLLRLLPPFHPFPCVIVYFFIFLFLFSFFFFLSMNLIFTF